MAGLNLPETMPAGPTCPQANAHGLPNVGSIRQRAPVTFFDLAAPGTGEEGPGAVPLIRRADILAHGLSDNHIRRARSQGVLRAVAPGVYVRVTEMDGMDGAARHRAFVSAVVPQLTGDPVVSHLSAAIMHRLPVESGQADPVHVIRSSPAKSRRGPVLDSHRATLLPGEVVTVGGLAVTSIARTVLDCACAFPFDDSVALATAALAGGQVTAAELADQLTRHARQPGVRRAASVLERAVGEVWTRATGSP